MAKCFADLWGVRHVAAMGRGIGPRRGGFLCGALGLFRANVDDAHRRAVGREPQSDRTADAAASAGNDGDFAVKTEISDIAGCLAQRETPRFQGIKSS